MKTPDCYKLFFKSTLFIFFTLFFGLNTFATGVVNSFYVTYDTHYYVKSGRLVEIDSVVIQVNNRFGERNITVNYNRFSKLKSFKAYVTDTAGRKIRKIPDGAFLDNSRTNESTFYTDLRCRTTTPSHNKYPYQVRYVVVMESKQFTVIANWIPVCSQNRPILHESLNIHTRRGYPLKLASYNCSDSLRITTGGRSWLRFNCTPPVVDDNDDSFVKMDRHLPQVLVCPERFTYVIPGKQKDWSDFGKWFDDLNANRLTLPLADQLVVKNVLDATPDTLERVRRLYHYLQKNTRYINITMEATGMQTYPAEYVSRNKFGDCKALTNYMKALLSLAGVKSYFVLINASPDNDLINTDFACSQFNHVVLMVPAGRDTLWLENTSGTTPFGSVGSFIHSRAGLLIDGVHSRIIRTPALTCASVHSSGIASIDCRDPRTVVMEIKNSLRGDRQQHYRQLHDMSDPDFPTTTAGYLIPDLRVRNLKIQEQADPVDARITHVHLRTELPDFCTYDAASLILPQIRNTMDGFSPVKPGRYSVRLFKPYSHSDTVEYVLPPGYTIRNKPEDFSFSNGQFHFQFHSLIQKEKIIYTSSISVQAGIITPDDYAVLYRTYSDFVSMQKIPFILQKSN